MKLSVSVISVRVEDRIRISVDRYKYKDDVK